MEFGNVNASLGMFMDAEDELMKLYDEAGDKFLEIEQKYSEIRRPIYIRRNEIIKAIPDFWLTAFSSHPALSLLLTNEDQKIFKYIDSLDVEDFQVVKSGFSVTFNFKPNPYFEDTTLTKTYSISDEGIVRVTGTNIRWKEGVGSANGVDLEKKGNNQAPPYQSFFSWFSGPARTHCIHMIPGEVGYIIKKDLWPFPLKYFSNDTDQEYSEYDEDEDDVDEE